MTEPADVAFDHQAVTDLLGVFGCATLSGFLALSADAAHMPDVAGKSGVAAMAARYYRHHELVRSRLVEAGADPDATMTPFMAVFEEFHARTAPSDWVEGLVKSYVGDGIAADFHAEIARYVEPGTREFILALLADEHDDALVIARVRAALDADPRLAGRLALWARRIMGEALQQAQRVVVERDALAQLLVGGTGIGADLAEAGRMFARIADAHSERMHRLGLTA